MSIQSAARWVVLMPALLGSTPVVAAQEPGAERLRLGDLYRDLEARSPRLRAASASSRAAALRVGPVSRLPDPSLQLATMNRDLPGFALNDVLGMNQLQLMQMIPLGGRTGRTAEVARARALVEDANLPETVFTERGRVARGFYTLYRFDRTLDVLGETRDLLRGLERAAEALYAVGTGRQADVLRAQVEVARMTEEIERMAAMRVAEAARLNGALDRPAGHPLSRAVLPGLDPVLPGLDSLVSLALSARPMLRAVDAQVAAAAAEERRAASEIWPDLTVGASYGWRGMPQGGTEHMLSLMIGASLPVWAGSRQKQMRQEAVAMREMAQADRDALRAETQARVVEVMAELTRGSKLLSLYRGTVLPQARAAVSSAMAAYQAGSVDFMTVLDNQMTVNRYRIELVALVAERGTLLAELEMLTGQRWTDPDSLGSDETEGAP